MGDLLRGDELVALRRKTGTRVSGVAWGLDENLGKIHGPEGCEMSGFGFRVRDHSLTSFLWRFGERGVSDCAVCRLALVHGSCVCCLQKTMWPRMEVLHAECALCDCVSVINLSPV